MALNTQIQVGPQGGNDGALNATYGGPSGEIIMDSLHGRYYEQALRGNVFVAHSAATAPAAYTSVAGLGGPLIWNSSPTTMVVILAVSITMSVASTVAGSLGLTGGIGQLAPPGSTTAITSQSCGLISRSNPKSSIFKIGTITASKFFLPLYSVELGATTTFPALSGWIDVNGAVICPPFSWVSIAANVVLTTGQFAIGIVYEEVPI